MMRRMRFETFFAFLGPVAALAICILRFFVFSAVVIFPRFVLLV